LRAFPQGGGFWVFRRDLAEITGYFDEALISAADFDMSIRIALSKCEMGRIPEPVGFFTDVQEGISTRNDVADMERSLLQIRYGIYDKLRSRNDHRLMGYQLEKIQNFGEWILLSDLIPGYHDYLAGRRPLILLGKLRNFLRSFLKRIGLLDLIYAFQKRFIKQEI
jgi:hypothetical protein